MSDQERVEAFLRDLTDLTRKHGIIITVDEVGLPKAPIISFASWEDLGFGYGTDADDRLTWGCP